MQGHFQTFTKRAGSFGSAVGERTRNNCTRVKCWVHIHVFSGSFGSAVEIFLWRAEFIYLAARLARQWMKERGIQCNCMHVKC